MPKLDRRKAMALLAMSAAGTMTGAASGALAQGTKPTAKPGLPAAYFSRDPAMSRPQISPDGTRLAWIEDNRLVIYTLDTEDEKALPGGANTLSYATWINNDFLAVYLKQEEVQTVRYTQILGYSPLVVSKDAKFIRLLFAHDGNKMSAADLRPIVRFVDAPEPYVITMGGNNTNIIDVATGKRKVGARFLEGEAHFFDHNGEERLSVEVNDGKLSYGIISLQLHYRPTPGGKVEILHLPKRDNVYYTNFHYSEFDNAIYWAEFDYATSTASIFRYDMTTSAKSLYRTGPNKDMDIEFDTYGRIVGLTTVTDRVETEWTDPDRLKITAAVQAIFPSATIDIADMTRDGKQVVLSVSAPEEPDSYYYYSADSKELSRIGVNYPELEDQPLAAMTYVTYKARDGLDIPAYITRLKDTPPRAPLVVFPHGGPASRDVYGFNYMAQYLASRGYVILQPQYRGSGGFSDAFQRAGNKQLDKMTTDLEDGVRFLAGQGMIDPAKVCVMGWSWGGYLTQAALAFTPDTYVCGVSGAGVSDLAEVLDESNDFYWGGYSKAYWAEVIGGMFRDGARIKAVSPIEHVDAIKVPLLLIHGEADRTVSVHQSERMNAAMQKAGKTVTYIPVKYMHHGPNDAAQRQQVLTAMGNFIAEAFAKVGKT